MTRSGVKLLLEHFRDVLKRKGRIRFLTGDYLDFTEPEALRQLGDLREMEGLEGTLDLRVFDARHTSFHPKAFILHFAGGAGTAFVGSSNLTRTALQTGVEWNYRAVTSADRGGFNDVCAGFETLYAHRDRKSVV